MATNPKALELAKQGKVEYDWGTLWPHYHKEKMNWAGGFRTKGDVDILFLSGQTGRDPFEDAPCRTPEEERAGKTSLTCVTRCTASSRNSSRICGNIPEMPHFSEESASI